MLQSLERGKSGSDWCVPTVSFVHKNLRSKEVVKALHARKLAVRNGHMYSLRVVQQLTQEPSSVFFHDVEDGVVRISALHYNTPEQIQAVLDCVRELT